jgi:PASTA domain
MKFFQKMLWMALGTLVLQSSTSFTAARAADLVFCVNKSTRVVTYPASGKCTANSFALNVSSNTINLPKSHTTTAAIAPKSGPLKVFVPNVLTMDENRARLTLSNLGLKVAVKMLKKGPNAKVIQVVPNVGSPVASGSVVTIVVG